MNIVVFVGPTIVQENVDSSTPSSKGKLERIQSEALIVRKEIKEPFKEEKQLLVLEKVEPPT